MIFIKDMGPDMKKFVLIFSAIGFFIPLVIVGFYFVFKSLVPIGRVELLLDAFFYLIWPLFLGLMYLESGPSIGYVVSFLFIMCVINSLFYGVFGMIIWGVVHKSRYQLFAFLALGLIVYFEYKWQVRLMPWASLMGLKGKGSH